MGAPIRAYLTSIHVRERTVMPDLDDADVDATHDAGATGGAPSRRSLLRAAAGAGAAGLAATALTRAIPSASASGRADATPAGHADAGAHVALTEAIIVHVRDASTGELDVFRGTSEVRVKDRDLAARIVRASR
jgi:hypothetical protein